MISTYTAWNGKTYTAETTEGTPGVIRIDQQSVAKSTFSKQPGVIMSFVLLEDRLPDETHDEALTRISDKVEEHSTRNFD